MTAETDPPPFATMGTDEVLEWVATTWERWQQLPLALSVLVDQGVHYVTIREYAGVPTTTAHRKVRQARASG